MSNKIDAERCLAEADAADRLANGFDDAASREIWRQIAQGYRELAQAALDHKELSTKPSQALPLRPVKADKCDDR